MPLIKIESLETYKDQDTAINNIINSASEKTAFAKDSLIIKWDVTNNSLLYRKGNKINGSNDESNIIIINLTLSKRNSRSDTDDLVKEIVNSLSKTLKLEASNFCVVINHMDEGNIFVNGQFI
jgi:phenylpyruvate tautomerase PptA (4-oxalocrotonate tautomerase family)